VPVPPVSFGDLLRNAQAPPVRHLDGLGAAGDAQLLEEMSEVQFFFVFSCFRDSLNRAL
jgi:hypothetical protein